MKITIPYNKIIIIATISIVGLQRVAAHVDVRAGEFGLCRSGSCLGPTRARWPERLR
jgi:hypothetical protein